MGNSLTDGALLTAAVAVIGALVGTLASVLAWVGVQIKREISLLSGEVKKTNETLSKIERDLRGELTSLDRRLTRVEATCSRGNPAAHASD